MWMRALAAFVMLSACKIADIHFIGPGVGDDAGGDGVHLDSSGDGTVAATHHAYLIDSSAGIFVLARNDAGALAFTSTTYPGAFYSSAVSSLGHLYVTVLNPSAVRDYKIQPDGTLAMASEVAVACVPQDLVLSPDGSLLAFGCQAAMVGAMRVDPMSGALGQVFYGGNGTGTSYRAVALSPDGRCLFASDDNAPAGVPSLYGFIVTATGTLGQGGQISGPQQSRALVADPTHLYVAGPSNFEPFTYSANCGLTGMIPNPTPGGNEHAAIDPTGKFIYTVGNGVTVFTLVNGNVSLVTGSPFLPVNGGIPITGVTTDPALPGILYVTDASYHGVQVAHVDLVQGTVTTGPIVSQANVANARWLQLGP